MTDPRSKHIKSFQVCVDQLYGLVIKHAHKKHHKKFRDRKAFSLYADSDVLFKNQFSHHLYNNVLSAFETYYGFICIGFRFPEFHSNLEEMSNSKSITLTIESEWRSGANVSTQLSLKEFKLYINRLQQLILLYRRGLPECQLKNVPHNNYLEMFSYIFLSSDHGERLIEALKGKSDLLHTYLDVKKQYKSEKGALNRQKKENKKKQPKQNPQITINNAEISALKAKIRELEAKNRAIQAEDNAESYSKGDNMRKLHSELTDISLEIKKDTDTMRSLNWSPETSSISELLLSI